ncbi:MAG: Fic family protein [Oscillospiraceae bacterium]|nr:Fic family protein [Oscillospiraceae bacterium]
MSKYYYEYERVNAYCYPDSFVLRNKFDIRNGAELYALERELTAVSMAQAIENPIKGKFDLKHLCAIHKFIFSEIYDWAGELRTVNIAKGNQFCLYQHLERYAEGVFKKIKDEKLLSAKPPENITERLAYHLGEINVLHPFRDGNGRTQRVFIEYMAQAAGYSVDFGNVSSAEMIEASALAFAQEYDMITAMFKRITFPISAEERQAARLKMGLNRSKRT